MENDFILDVGQAQTKFRVGNKQGKMPSAVAPEATIAGGDFAGADGRQTVDGRTLVVGNAALDPFCKQIYNRNMDWLIEYLPYLFAQAAKEAGISDLTSISTLSTGIPIDNSHEWEAKLIERMNTAKIDGNQHSFKIVVTKQGVGSMIACRCEQNGLHDNDRGLVIDVGGNTVIIVSHNRWVPMRAGSKQYNTSGLSVAAESLRMILESVNGKKYTLIETLAIMRVREVSGRAATEININNEIDKVLSTYAKGLVAQISQDYGEYMGALDHLILSGGGAAVIRPHLPQDWPKVIMLEEPEFGNLRGYAYRLRDGV